jgi:hypothetical protein
MGTHPVADRQNSIQVVVPEAALDFTSALLANL